MSDDGLNITDSGVRGDHGAHVTSVRLVGFDRPFFTALAICLAIAAIIMAFWAERESRMAEYYAVDLEMCLLKNICPNKSGVPVPADPWSHKPGDHK